MAAAARSNPADARVPCPLCGGLVHPIAGKCKHCKGDLSALRSARPAAAASLPALHANGHVQMNPYAGPTNGHAHGHANGHAPASYVPAPAPGPYEPRGPAMPQMPARPHAAPVPMPVPVRDGSQPILPPRPTGRMPAVAATAAWWKSWPLIVIVLAVLAIVTAVILMVWPPAKPADAGEKAKGLTPAPERMDTNPLPPGPQPPPRAGDPWQGQQGGVAPKPPDIDIPDDPDPPDPDDPTAADPNLQGSAAIMMSMMRHACDRAASCGQLDATVKDYCEMTKKFPLPPVPASCPAARRCLDHIDQMSCSGGFGDVTKLAEVMYKFQDCVEAINC